MAISETTTATAVGAPKMEGTAGVVDGKLILSQGITRVLNKNGAGGHFTEVPTIDLSPLTSPDSSSPQEMDQMVQSLRDACTTAGFFVIKNHGIDWGIVERCFESCREFFGLPLEAKMKYHQSKSASFMGYEEAYYTNVNRLGKGDLKESMTSAYEPEQDPDGAGYQPDLLLRQNLWPDEDAPSFKPAMREYRAACLKLMRKLVKVMERVIGVEEGFFDKKATYPVAGIRALYYPPQDPDDDQSTGLGAHTDVQFMTMIAQDPYDAQSLEVLNAGGEWIKPRLQPETFVVNLSDIMARLTNNVFQSTIHRVANRSGQPRYSLPFFFGLNNDELISTLPKFITPETPLCEGYETPITAYEHYNRRMQRAHHKHPTAVEKQDPRLPKGMTKINGVIVEGL